MFITPQERVVQGALDAFWYEHYTKQYSIIERNDLVAAFSDKWLDSTKIKTDKAFIRHPATKLRNYDRGYTIADVLADFIMRADQVEERKEEYPLSNPDHAVNGVFFRKEHERSIFFQYEEDVQKEGDTLPAYSVKESDIVLPNSIEDILFAETVPNIEQFRTELRKVKKFAEFYSTIFSEEYGYDKRDALRRIKQLDLSRVRECEICGSAFYTHDLRRHICDMQRGIIVHKEKGKKPIYEVTDYSTCEIERDNKKAQERYKIGILDEKKSII